MDYDDLNGQINPNGANIRCEELKKLLESAGFKVKRNKGNHHTFTHDGLTGFTTSSFNGSHGRNSQVLRCNIRKILKIIAEYKEELIVFLEKNQ